jgi:hypothetical protein
MTTDQPLHQDLRLKIRIVRKLADYLDGVDLRGLQPGDCVDMVPSQARLLLLEGWAELVDPIPIEVRHETPVLRRKDDLDEDNSEADPY